jgi:hypothetical protein
MPSGKHNGWNWDRTNGRLDFYYQGTRVGHITAAGLTSATALASGTTMQCTTLGITSGNHTVTAGDARITGGNLRLGGVSAFANTEPTSAVVMKVGTAPAGAITTSGGVFSSSTVVQKIIAVSTVSNIET